MIQASNYCKMWKIKVRMGRLFWMKWDGVPISLLQGNSCGFAMLYLTTRKYVGWPTTCLKLLWQKGLPSSLVVNGNTFIVVGGLLPFQLSKQIEVSILCMRRWFMHFLFDAIFVIWRHICRWGYILFQEPEGKVGWWRFMFVMSLAAKGCYVKKRT